MTLSDLSSGVVCHRDRWIFYSLCLGVLLGAFFTNSFSGVAIFPLSLVMLLAGVVGISYRSSRVAILMLISGTILGSFVASQRADAIRVHTAEIERRTGYFTRTLTIDAALMRRISESPSGTSYLLSDVRLDGEYVESVRLVGRFTRTHGLDVGDRVSFSGRLERPTDDLDGFDYRSYLLLRDAYATVAVNQFREIGDDHANIFTRMIRVVHRESIARIESIYPGESAKLLQGILIGERSGLSDATRNDFNRTGLSHIIAVSGSNITILLLFLWFFLRPFPIALRWIGVWCWVSLFVLLVGADAPVLRAWVFGLVGYSVFSVGRNIRPIPVLLAIATGFVLLDPLILSHDLSFQLSFLAVLGLICLAWPLSRLFRFLPRIGAIRESVVLSIAAMIATLPLMIGNFWQVSVVSPFANALVVPLLPFVMLFGFLSIALSFVSTTASVAVGFCAWGLLDFSLRVAHLLGQSSFSTFSIQLGAFAPVFLVGWYTVLVAWAISSGQTKKTP